MPPLLPATAGTVALYRPIEAAQDDEREVLAVPVEAWDDTGAPLVADRAQLVAVAAFRDQRLSFARLAPRTEWTGRPAEEARRQPIPPVEVERIIDPPAGAQAGAQATRRAGR